MTSSKATIFFPAKEEAVIVDTVSYEGLEIGREYTVAGKLMDKETGEPILVNGEEVTASETFTAETEEGGIDITFTFDSSFLPVQKNQR